MNNTNLTAILTELHKAFNDLNKTFYGGQLPSVVITVQKQHKVGNLGWFTPAKLWNDGTEQKHEINISAEGLDRGYNEIIRTLHHEMIHLYCHVNNIKDVSRGNTYHNTRFKKACEERGFYYKDEFYSKKIGWSHCELTEETIEIINNFNVDKEVFKLHRLKTLAASDKPKKKSNIIKWTCGCGTIVRSSKDGLKLICGECGTYFTKDGEEPTTQGANAQDGE